MWIIKTVILQKVKTSTKDKLNEKMFDLLCCLQYNKTKWPVKEAKVVST